VRNKINNVLVTLAMVSALGIGIITVLGIYSTGIGIVFLAIAKLLGFHATLLKSSVAGVIPAVAILTYRRWRPYLQRFRK
jgi:hypothetical protein